MHSKLGMLIKTTQEFVSVTTKYHLSIKDKLIPKFANNIEDEIRKIEECIKDALTLVSIPQFRSKSPFASSVKATESAGNSSRRELQSEKKLFEEIMMLKSKTKELEEIIEGKRSSDLQIMKEKMAKLEELENALTQKEMEIHNEVFASKRRIEIENQKTASNEQIIKGLEENIQIYSVEKENLINELEFNREKLNQINKKFEDLKSNSKKLTSAIEAYEKLYDSIKIWTENEVSKSISSYEGYFFTYDEKLNNIMNRVDQVSIKCRNFEEKICILKNNHNNQALQNKINETKIHYDEILKKNRDEFEFKLKKLTEIIADLEQDRNDLLLNVKNLESQANYLKEENSKIQQYEKEAKEIEEIYSQFKKLKESYNNTLNNLKNKDIEISNLKTKIFDQETKFAELSKDYVNQEIMIQNMQSEFSNNNSNTEDILKQLKKEINSSQAKEKEMSQLLIDANKDAAKLWDEINQKNNQLNSITNLINSKEQKINELTKSFESLHFENDLNCMSKDNEINKLKETLQKIKEENCNLIDEKRIFENSERKNQGRLDQVKRKIDELEEFITQQHEENSKLNMIIVEKEKEINESDKKQKEVENDLIKRNVTLGSEIEAVQNCLDSQRHGNLSDITKLKDENQILIKKIQELEKSCYESQNKTVYYLSNQSSSINSMIESLIYNYDCGIKALNVKISKIEQSITELKRWALTIVPTKVKQLENLTTKSIVIKENQARDLILEKQQDMEYLISESEGYIISRFEALNQNIQDEIEYDNLLMNKLSEIVEQQNQIRNGIENEENIEYLKKEIQMIQQNFDDVVCKLKIADLEIENGARENQLCRDINLKLKADLEMISQDLAKKHLDEEESESLITELSTLRLKYDHNYRELVNTQLKLEEAKKAEKLSRENSLVKNEIGSLESVKTKIDLYKKQLKEQHLLEKELRDQIEILYTENSDLANLVNQLKQDKQMNEIKLNEIETKLKNEIKQLEDRMQYREEKIGELECYISLAKEALGGFFDETLEKSITALVTQRTQAIKKPPRPAPVMSRFRSKSRENTAVVDHTEAIMTQAALSEESKNSDRSWCSLPPPESELHQELKDQLDLSEVQTKQVNLLKETIRDLERQLERIKRFKDSGSEVNIEMLKDLIIKLCKGLPQLSREAEGMITVILTMIAVSKQEMTQLQDERRNLKAVGGIFKIFKK